MLGWVAKHRPELLAVGEFEFAENTLRDGWWLAHRCREQGIAPVKVDAPSILREQGIEHVNAYPVRLLEQRLG